MCCLSFSMLQDILLYASLPGALAANIARHKRHLFLARAESSMCLSGGAGTEANAERSIVVHERLSNPQQQAGNEAEGEGGDRQDRPVRRRGRPRGPRPPPAQPQAAAAPPPRNRAPEPKQRFAPLHLVTKVMLGHALFRQLGGWQPSWNGEQDDSDVNCASHAHPSTSSSSYSCQQCPPCCWDIS